MIIRTQGNTNGSYISYIYTDTWSSEYREMRVEIYIHRLIHTPGHALVNIHKQIHTHSRMYTRTCTPLQVHQEVHCGECTWANPHRHALVPTVSWSQFSSLPLSIIYFFSFMHQKKKNPLPTISVLTCGIRSAPGDGSPLIKGSRYPAFYGL